jgi:hypothetical protein
MDIHNCPALLTRIEREEESNWLDKKQCRVRTCLLVRANGTTDEIATFEIGRTIAAQLSKFVEPKTYNEFRRKTAGDTAGAAWDWSDIPDLCDDGVLEIAA